MRLLAVTGLGLLGCAFALVAGEREANACGGCFAPPPSVTETESVITDEKMIFSISTTQTTLYDEITYSGSPSSFAWVLPIKGTVQVGLSADVMFQVLNQLTATEVTSPTPNCTCGHGGIGGSGGSGGGSRGGGGSGGGGGVTVTAQQQVGPYETVQLHSNDGSALTAWLSQHGYAIPASTRPVISSYVTQGFDFLALKLVPGMGVQAMQPVRITSTGASPSLPLHMVAVGTGATTGITIWVVADGRWAPGNFPTFTIADSELTWDWTTESSNYETVRRTKEASFHGRGWQIESSLELSQFSVTESVVDSAIYATQGAYTPLPGDGDAGNVAAQSDAANADLAVMFAGVAAPNARITRMRSDVAKAALSVDMTLEAAADQSELSNDHIPQHTLGIPVCAPGCVPADGGATTTGGSTTTFVTTETTPAPESTTASPSTAAPGGSSTRSTVGASTVGASTAGTSIAGTSTVTRPRGASVTPALSVTGVSGGCNANGSPVFDGGMMAFGVGLGWVVVAGARRRRKGA